MPETIASFPKVGESGGPAAPAQAKQQPGAAAPGGNAKPVGSPSTPSSDDAIVAAKKQAEHWRNKHERDVGELRQTVSQLSAKLEGLATGVAMNGQPAAKAPAKTFQDLDETSLDDIVKKGVEENNPGYIAESAKEYARRAAEKAEKRAVETARAEIIQTMETQRVYARVSNEFGAAVLDQDSELRQVADARIADLNRRDPDWMKKDPERLFDIFARADREIRASEKGELERLRKQETDRSAREEIERSTQVIATKARADVSELLAKGDKQSRREALAIRLPWINRP